MNKALNIFISHASDMLTDCKPHGDGLMADRFIRELAARGHRIHVAVEHWAIEVPYSSNVTLHRIGTNSSSFGLTSRLKFAIGVRGKIHNLCKHERIDVIHQLNPVVSGLSLALWPCHVPIVLGPYLPDWPMIVYDGVLRKPKGADRVRTYLKTEIIQLQHRIASATILSTPAALSKVRDIGAMRPRLATIPYGVDTEMFSPSPRSPDRTILFVGHLMHHKGVFVLLDAFRRVLRALPDCRLLLAGSGSEIDAVKAEISRLDFPMNVTLLGNVGRKDLAQLIRESAVLCIPSFGEAFGLVALEAMSCGRPVVGTNASGLAHLITEGGGRRVPVGDADALASSLIEVLSDTELARAMGEHNRRVVESQYSWPVVIDQLESVYHSAIQTKRAGGFQ
jgi:glycosyltransferase involved in cell wall biosynthesis